MIEELGTIEKQIAALEKEREEVFAELEPLQSRNRELYDDIKELRERRDTLRLAAREDTESIDFDLLMMADPPSTALYREQQRQMSKLGFIRGGYWSDTNQAIINISLTRGDAARTKEVFNGLSLVLPHIIPNENGERRVHLLEHTCSEYGMYTLLVGETADDEVSLQLMRYSHPSIEATFPNLMAALEYCEQRHYSDSGED